MTENVHSGIVAKERLQHRQLDPEGDDVQYFDHDVSVRGKSINSLFLSKGRGFLLSKFNPNIAFFVFVDGTSGRFTMMTTTRTSGSLTPNEWIAQPNNKNNNNNNRLIKNDKTIDYHKGFSSRHVS